MKIIREKLTRSQLKRNILMCEPQLTQEMVDKYTDSELKEWARLLGYGTEF